MTQVLAQVKEKRRYDIDWLRTLAFSVLILYHVGMYYVLEWGWHIKSPHQSEWLQDLMVLTNPWRMSLLFFVSGMALALYFNQTKGPYIGWRLFGLRTNRLLIPLVFSMYVIVPPQLFYELQQQHGLTLSYWAFLQEYWNIDTSLAAFKHSSIGLLTWNHLWFLPYLWCYTIVFLLIKPLLERILISQPDLIQACWPVFAFLVFTTGLIWLLLRETYPTTHDLLNDWYSHAKYFWVLLGGYCLVKLPLLWQNIIEQRRRFLSMALICYCLIILDRHGYLQFIAQYYTTSLLVKSVYGTLYISNHWAWILAVVAYAGRYLNFSNAFIVYANQAILPWYIFHQTFIVVIAMQLLPFNLSAGVEAPILILLTSVGCLLAYEIVRRLAVTRWLLGLKVILFEREKCRKKRGAETSN